MLDNRHILQHLGCNILCYASQEINHYSEVGSWQKMKCIVILQNMTCDMYSYPRKLMLVSGLPLLQFRQWIILLSKDQFCSILSRIEDSFSPPTIQMYSHFNICYRHSWSNNWMLLCFLTMLNDGMNMFPQRFTFRIVHQFHYVMLSLRHRFNDANFDLKFLVQMETFCNCLIEPHWTIHKEAIWVKTDFQNLSGGTCHPTTCFDYLDSSSVTHALKTKIFVCTLFTGIADQHVW